MARRKTALALVEAPAPTRIRLGLGFQPGDPANEYTLVESLEGVKDESVEHLVVNCFFHRLTRDQRYAFANEAHRVLIPTKQWTVIGPYYTSHLTITDPLAQWPPLSEGSFLVYSRAWREQEKLDLGLTCNFGQNFVAGHVPEPDMASRNEEYRATASRHWWNSVRELHVTLTKLTT